MREYIVKTYSHMARTTVFVTQKATLHELNGPLFRS